MDQASLLLRKQLKGAGVGFASAAEALCKLLSAAVRCVGLYSCTSAPLTRAVRDAELTKRPVEGFSAGLVDDINLFEWQVTIMGPPDTY